jgi:orotate phosphoribosyltransferase
MPVRNEDPETERLPRAELVRWIAGVATLTGEFRLRSGQLAERYFDKYQFEADPRLLAPLAAWMLDLVREGFGEVDILAGLELGGVPLATAMSLASGLPAVFVRKAAKSYGTAKAVEGPSVAGRRVVIVEDVITTGGQVVSSAGLLREAGAAVVGVVCAIRRGEDLRALGEAGLALRWAITGADLDAAHTAAPDVA